MIRPCSGYASTVRRDLKSWDPNGSYGFDSRPGYLMKTEQDIAKRSKSFLRQKQQAHSEAVNLFVGRPFQAVVAAKKTVHFDALKRASYIFSQPLRVPSACPLDFAKVKLSQRGADGTWKVPATFCHLPFAIGSKPACLTFLSRLRFAHFAIGVLFFHLLAFVVQFTAFADSQSNLDEATFKEHCQRDERQSFVVRRFDDFANLSSI